MKLTHGLSLISLLVLSVLLPSFGTGAYATPFPSCIGAIDLNTGIYPSKIATPYGTSESHWSVIYPAPNTVVPAYSTHLGPWYPYGSPPDPRMGPGNRADWISPFVNMTGFALNNAPTADYNYTRIFSGPGTLYLNFSSDNAVSITLDHILIGNAPANWFNVLNAITTQPTPVVGSGPHQLTAIVHNDGHYTGFLAIGELCPKIIAGPTGPIPSGPTESKPIPTNCIHWDKIVFVINKDPSGKIPKNLIGTELDIKVKDDPAKVADIEGKIKTFLKNGTQVEPSGSIPPLDPTELNGLSISIVTVDYAIACESMTPSSGTSISSVQPMQDNTTTTTPITKSSNDYFAYALIGIVAAGVGAAAVYAFMKRR